MGEWESVRIVLEAFDAVEQRDEPRLVRLYHPDVEFHWPASLPYGGSFHGLGELQEPQRKGWASVWDPFQRTAGERKMDPRLVAATASEVVVHWHQRGVTAGGERIDMETLGLYEVRDGKFARAQMFYFDTAALLRFLGQAE
jgi:ketosteroid isomerase-like protein